MAAPRKYLRNEARLAQGAATLVGPGPVALETWGEAEETLSAYAEHGFVLVDYVPVGTASLNRAEGAAPGELRQSSRGALGGETGNSRRASNRSRPAVCGPAGCSPRAALLS